MGSQRVGPNLATEQQQMIVERQWKINETKRWFFKKISKTDKPSARNSKKKRRLTSLKWEMETGHHCQVFRDRRMMRGFDKTTVIQQVKLDTLNKMDKFLETQNLSKLNQKGKKKKMQTHL